MIIKVDDRCWHLSDATINSFENVDFENSGKLISGYKKIRLDTDPIIFNLIVKLMRGYNPWIPDDLKVDLVKDLRLFKLDSLIEKVGLVETSIKFDDDEPKQEEGEQEVDTDTYIKEMTERLNTPGEDLLSLMNELSTNKHVMNAIKDYHSARASPSDGEESDESIPMDSDTDPRFESTCVEL